MIFKQNLDMSDDALKCKSLEAYSLPYDADFSSVHQILEDYEYVFMTKKSGD